MQEDIPMLLRVSEKKTLNDDELDYAIKLLIESEKIKDNDELYNNVLEAARKKAKVYRSLKSLRDAASEMDLNPGKTRGEDDDGKEAIPTKKASSKD